jgi:ATP-binding cassette subfamily B protein
MSKKLTTNQLTLQLLWRGASRYPLLLWPLLLAIPVSVLLNDFVLPYITADILQRLSSGHYDAHNVWASFGKEVIWFAVAAIAGGVITWRLSIWLIWTLENNVTRDIAALSFKHLMRMSANFHSNRFGGSLVSQSNKLTGAYIRIADTTIFNILPLIVMLTATIIILAPRVPVFVAMLIIASVIFIAGTTWLSGPVRRANTRESRLQSRQTGYLADSIANIFAVKTFARSAHEEKRYWDAVSDVRAASSESKKVTLLRENFAALITQGIKIAAIFIAVVGVGLLKADIATIFLMVTYTSLIAGQLWEFQNVLRQYNRALGDASDMIKILQIEPEIADPKDPEPVRITKGAIELDNMTFTHPETPAPLFDHLNLSIAPGEKIGLVGRSGSGKTSLTKLLLRFSDLDSGSIKIDGQNIARITQDDLHRAVSYVPQEPLLFHRSLSENIAYGHPGATQAEIEAAADRAHASEFIAKLPQGYDTLVGERGIKLSGGQRQRIAIARAMLKPAPVLVLDEATSALDSESEKLIQDALWRLMEGRTAIVVAHRLSTIAHMDRIIVLDHGRIVEQGSHAELIKRRGQYAALWNHQSGGFIEEETEEPSGSQPVPA